MKEIILAYQGEMTLKGLNRAKFEARLAKIIRWRLEPLGKFKVYQAQSTVFIEPKEEGLDMDEAFRRVFPMCSASSSSAVRSSVPRILTPSARLPRPTLARRCAACAPLRSRPSAPTGLPMKSPEICRELGAYLLDKHHHLRVDVHKPPAGDHGRDP